ncbi:unnamed protein product [Fraxinus pennsylvanica]|uniref:Uncharacterized protein n=1 Tax=Fraxinus pennsylvanica TaxID=56036 RepID=A0AAD1ZH36_9LAMI|nr:unnamed protein product [Fraxinus pennsylvanica]
MASALAFSLGAIVPLLAAAFTENYKVKLGVVVAAVTLALIAFGEVGAVMGGAPVDGYGKDKSEGVYLEITFPDQWNLTKSNTHSHPVTDHQPTTRPPTARRTPTEAKVTHATTTPSLTVWFARNVTAK